MEKNRDNMYRRTYGVMALVLRCIAFETMVSLVWKNLPSCPLHASCLGHCVNTHTCTDAYTSPQVKPQ